MTGTFAGYELLEEMGRGAAGVVYRAREAVTGRAVALKVVTRELAASPGFAERFQREARAAGSVEHENVARLFGTGEAEGRPFLVLELVTGGSLADRLRSQGPLPWREAAARAAEIARGLGAVHAAGLVHRDVTPGNVLLDASGRAKLADFGLVRLVGARSPGEIGSLTKTGEVVGTLEFLSPEQANGAGEVDARADLYGLGATLHALVTGAPPFQGDSFALVKQHLLARPPGLRELVPDAPPDLDALVQRLLEKDPALRGEGAVAVASELEAIAAGDEAPGSETTRRGLLAGALALAAGGVGLGAGVFLRSRLRPAPSPSPSLARLPSLSPSPEGPDAAASRLANDPELAETVEHWRAGKFKLVAIWGRAAWKAPTRSLGVAVSPDGKWAISGEDDWHIRRWDLASGHLLDVHDCTGQPRTLALSAAGDRLATGGYATSDEKAIEVTDLAGWRTRRIAVPTIATGLAFSPDGKRLLSGHVDGKLRLHDLERETEALAIDAHDFNARVQVAFAGAHAALSGSEDGTVKLWDMETGREVAKLPVASPVGAIAPSPGDPDQVLVGTGDGRVSLWSFVKERSLWSEPYHPRSTTCVAFSPDGLVAASGDESGRVAIIDVASPRKARLIAAHRSPVTRIAFTPDGKRFVTSSFDQTIGLFDVATGADRRAVSGHRGLVGALAVVPSRAQVLSGGDDGLVQVWDAASGRTLSTILAHDARILSIAVTPDGRRALTGAIDGSVRLWDLEHGQPLAAVDAARRHGFTRLALSPDGQRAISVEGFGAIAAWELEPLARHPLREPRRDVPPEAAAAFLPDGRALVGGAGGEILLWDSRLERSRTLAPPLPGRDVAITTLAVLPDGRSFLAGTAAGIVQLWDLEGRAVSAFDPGPGAGRVEGMAPAPDGRTFAAAYFEGSVRHWDVASSSELDRFGLDRKWDGCVSLAWLDGRSLLVGMLRGEILRVAL